jgi:periplasmic copper chaperone A
MPILRLFASLVALVALAAALGSALPATAQVAVDGAWARASIAGQKTTAAYMKLTSIADTALIDAASPLAKIVEIHEMKQDGAMMKMSAVDRVPLPAGKPVELKPGGYHVMLFDLARPLKQGETLPLTLTFQDKGGEKRTQNVQVPVIALTADGKPAPVK